MFTRLNMYVKNIAVTASIIVGLFASTQVAVLAGMPNLVGTWNCCGVGGAAAQVFIITSGVTGRAELPGGRVFAAITGSKHGNRVKIITTYNDFSPGYVAVFIGTVLADGNTISGTWKSNANQSGTWTATRGPKPTEEPTFTPAQPGDVVARIVEIKSITPGKQPKLEYFRDGEWHPSSKSIDLQVGDSLRTDENTIAAFEFTIGGRIGMGKDSEIDIRGERAVKQFKKPTSKWNPGENNEMWVKVQKLHAEPLEIQTNGGVTSIKG